MNPQQKAQRLPLFHAIAIALFAATSEQAFATELEQEAKARARVAEIVDQLPDLGSEPP